MTTTNNQAFFGAGTLVLRRTDVANIAPSFLGVLQDITISTESKQVPLMGQQRFAVDLASGPAKITGKAKSALMKITLPNLLWGSTVNSGMTELANGTAGQGEAQNIPTTPYQVTVTNAATYLADYGVYFQNGLGQLQPVASGPTTGQYSVNTATGVYTFAAADTGKGVFVYYSYTTTGGYNFTLANPNMGTATPYFELYLKNTTTFQGVSNDWVMKLNACKASKLDMNFKNDAWMIPDFEFEAFADSSGNTMTWSSAN